jgi:hypothetical protein
MFGRGLKCFIRSCPPSFVSTQMLRNQWSADRLGTSPLSSVQRNVGFHPHPCSGFTPSPLASQCYTLGHLQSCDGARMCVFVCVVLSSKPWLNLHIPALSHSVSCILNSRACLIRQYHPTPIPYTCSHPHAHLLAQKETGKACANSACACECMRPQQGEQG